MIFDFITKALPWIRRKLVFFTSLKHANAVLNSLPWRVPSRATVEHLPAVDPMDLRGIPLPAQDLYPQYPEVTAENIAVFITLIQPCIWTEQDVIKAFDEAVPEVDRDIVHAMAEHKKYRLAHLVILNLFGENSSVQSTYSHTFLLDTLFDLMFPKTKLEIATVKPLKDVIISGAVAHKIKQVEPNAELAFVDSETGHIVASVNTNL